MITGTPKKKEEEEESSKNNSRPSLHIKLSDPLATLES